MNNKKVMPEDIDDELVRTIALSVDIDNLRGIIDWGLIRGTLAYLANNPIEPTVDQTKHLYGFDGQYDKGGFEHHRDPNMAAAMVEFQKIAFLKKEEELPREVQQMIDAFGEERYSDVAGCIRRAYKLGKECKK